MNPQPPTVLLVEDDRVLRDLIALTLARLDCRVIVADDGAHALTLAQAHRPHLVLLDVLLPRLNGFEVMRRLNGQSGRAVPVIVISALGMREVVEKAVRIGAQDFVVKPLDLGLLASKVQRVLAQNREGSAGVHA